ncbi:TetR/AcrR family transcriptional regulator [Cryptosporangium aurantiacum]|uniref:Transcriptional regulator, TetR family n=1 Tax=Cryptosporangium aurantiacum TaxID=134849 RepID=A0A1M7RNJ7_9ACTN|nr:TetR/AcrR family transcriptional regulator [Cryptosporangium aurantiacum]SHN47672.1 transcriptional regulator, TetR family [Cryptosporangium aurantiacum]
MSSGDVPILPRGHHHLSREEVSAAQRARLLTAIVDVVAEHGYAGTSVGAVLKRARISRETFYQHFTDKQDCFLAAFDDAANLLIAVIADALGPPEDPVLTRLDRVLATYLGVLSEAPTLARVFLIEVYGAGPAAVARRLAVQDRFAVAIADVILHGQRWRGGLDPQFLGRAVIGAVSALVTAHLAADEPAELPGLRGQLVAFIDALLDDQASDGPDHD